MPHYYVKMLGRPEIYRNKVMIRLPYRKVEALLYYLLVHKKATRDELVGVLWPNLDEVKAKKNLRNALYQLRKGLSENILATSRHHLIEINGDLKIETDIQILENDMTIEPINDKEFLRGFVLRNSEAFEVWLRTRRKYYQDLWVKGLLARGKAAYDNKEFLRAEQYGQALIDLEPYDEKGYRLLMKVYMENRQVNKAMHVYQQLANLLEKELGVTPDTVTQKLYSSLLIQDKTDIPEGKKQLETFFYGRNEELQSLVTGYERFFCGLETKHMVLVGEAGVGKTRLVEEFLKKLDKEKIFILRTDCYQVEEDYLLKPWKTILSDLNHIISTYPIKISRAWQHILSCLFPSFLPNQSQSTHHVMENFDQLKYSVIEEAISGVIEAISQEQKILLIIDDFQWMDPMSISLLTSLLLHRKQSDVLLIATLRKGYGERIERFILSLQKHRTVDQIEVQPLSKKDVKIYLSTLMSGFHSDVDFLERIYEETKGNLFFLVEFLKVIDKGDDVYKLTAKVKAILKSRLFDISKEGQKILNIASLFFDEVPLDVLKEVTGKDMLYLMDIMEELKDKFVVEEKWVEERIFYKFTHQKLREYIYMEQADTKKRLLHNKIGKSLEKMLDMSNDKRVLYPKLIYHFEQGNDHLAALKYTILNARMYLDFNHELFPQVNPTKAYTFLDLTKEASLNYLQTIEQLLAKVKNNPAYASEVITLELEFNHMKGRYLIREGDYEQGLPYIQQVIDIGRKYNKSIYVIEGLKQKIYHCIQINDIQAMTIYCQLALELADEMNLSKEKGGLLRLRGLNYLMSGNFSRAEETLKASIALFERLEKGNHECSLYKGAARNYLGDIEKNRGNIEGALKAYLEALKTCDTQHVSVDVPIISTNIGQIYFELGHVEEAKAYFERALEAYSRFNASWRRAVAEGYMTLIAVKEGAYNQGIHHLQQAKKYVDKFKNPYDKALLYRVMGDIRAAMEGCSRVRQKFEEEVPGDRKAYYKAGKVLFERLHKSYEADRLDRLMERG